MDFQPNLLQEPILRGIGHRGNEDVRAKLVTGGEQSGKSLCTSKDMGSKMPWCRLGWVVAPDYAQARPEMEYMIQDFSRIGLLDAANTSTPKEGPWWITLRGGARIRTLSAQDTSKIANEAPDYIAMVEAGQMPEEAYYRCLGRTAPRARFGTGWLFINGTLEGSSGWYPELAVRWHGDNPEGGRSFKLPSWSNEALYPGGWDNEEIQRQFHALPEHVFLERFGGERTPPFGLVFKEFDRFVHARGPIQLGGRASDDRTIVLPEDTPLQIWVDPGYAGGYAVLFAAIIHDVVYIVDEIYSKHLITEEVIRLAVTHPYWQNVTHCVMDIAGEQHQAMRSPAELWRASPERGGAGVSVTGQKVSILDAITRLRSFLRVDPRTNEPRLFISSKCQGFITELADKYRYPTDRGNEIRSEKPVPKDNHAINACEYGLVKNFGLVTRTRTRGALPRAVPAWERRMKGRN